MNSLVTTLLLLLLTQEARCTDQLRRRDTVTLDETERCVFDGMQYRCLYRGSPDTHLTALCPNRFIDTDCTCTMAGRSPITGFFANCDSCRIGEYREDWSVTYDCSNLWAEDEEEPEFEMAGFEVSPTPAPVPAVSLSSMNTRTSPPHYFPGTDADVVASTQIDSSKEGNWRTFWRAVGWP